MNLLFFLIPLLLVSLIPLSYAEIEKGIDYDKEILQTFPDGSQQIKFTSKPERILINNEYFDFRYSDSGSHLILETGHGSVKLNKSTCSFDFYPKGVISGSPLFTDSIVPKMATNGTNNWTEINQINSASCETYGSGYQLVAKRYASGVGFIEYKIINTGSAFKTQLEATNLSSQTNKKFGFTQTIDLNRDVIKFGGSQKNLDNYSNQTFNRVWLKNNESKIINLLNGLSFDFDLGFDTLESVYVLDTGINQSKISFNYLKNSPVILPNETLIIDPTFAYTTGTIKTIGDASCNGSADSTTTDGYIGGNSGLSNCLYSSYYWNITTIDDTATTINSLTIKYDGVEQYNNINCIVKSMEGNPSTMTNQQTKDDILDGTTFTTLTCNDLVTDATFSTASMGTDLLNELPVDNEWSVGMYSSSYGSLDLYRITGAELQVIYTTTPAPNAITTLSTSALGQTTATLTFTAPNLNGESLITYMLNVTTPQASTANTFNQNTTSTTINLSGLTLNTGYTAQASAYTLGGANWTYANVLNFTTLNFIPPSAPTLGAIALDDTSLRFTSVSGGTGDNATSWYGFRCVLNNAPSWTTVISNSSIPIDRIYEYLGLTIGDELVCQWRDGSVAGWSDWSNNATDILELQIIQSARESDADPIKNFETMIDTYGGIFFGLSLFPFVVMLFGFMATPKTIGIFAIITLMLMGIIHASGYFVYPNWYWMLMILFAIPIIFSRNKT